MDFEQLREHIGHNIVCVCYGTEDDVVNVSVKCEDCNTVLYSVNKYEPDIHHDSQITIIWSVEDVQFVRPDLTDKQCMTILRRIERTLDASLGVTWDTISILADDLYPRSK